MTGKTLVQRYILYGFTGMRIISSLAILMTLRYNEVHENVDLYDLRNRRERLC